MDVMHPILQTPELNVMKGIIAVTVVAIVLCTNIVFAEECDATCTKEYYPVCGENSSGNRHTYGNPCVFEYNVCLNPDIRFVKFGEC
ncbi:Kazal-type serine protease inhibitor domain [Popillia japonica]|uniref:Kazal-type serine protease inhibitor domain n=1 Tax=Popillia japonica TaxID=7064 RepID=A0AAW1JXV8_POPJA